MTEKSQRFSSAIAPRKNRRIGILTRISLTTVGITAAVTLTVILIALNVLNQHIQDLVKNEQFARLSWIAQLLDEKFEARKNLLRVFARSIPPSILADDKALHSFVMNSKDAKADFDNLAILNSSGILVANFSGTKSLGGSVVDRKYYKDTVASGKGLVSEPLINRFTGSPQVFITQPIFDSTGAVSHVVLAAIDLSKTSFLGTVARARFGENGYLFILDTEGTVVYHPQKDRIMKKYSADGQTNAATAMALSGFEGSTESTDSHGVYGLYAFKRIKSTNWILSAFSPQEDALITLNRVRTSSLISIFFLSLIAGIAAAMLMRRHLKPLLHLHADMLSQTDDSKQILPNVYNNDEIGDIGRAYAELTTKTADYADELRRKETRVREILNQAGDAYIECAVDGTITEWNRQSEETFGWTRDEAVGQKFTELIVPAQSRDAYSRGLEHFSVTGDAPMVNKRIEITGQHKDGHLVPIELMVGAVKDGDFYLANAFARDITKQNEAKVMLANSEQFLRSVTNNIPAMIGYVDHAQTYRFANEGYRTLLGVDPAAVVGKRISEILSTEVHELNKPRIARALNGERVHFELEIVKNGEKLYLMCDYIPFSDESGSSDGFLVMASDISARKVAEIKQALSEQVAFAASQAKSEFLANMSHEIRTPMNAVLGITHILERSMLNSAQREYVKMIATSGGSLLRIIDDVLDFSKIEAGKFDVVDAPFELSDVLANLASIMRTSSEHKNLELLVSIDENVPQSLVGDANRLQQILVNLVGNGMKFTENGEVSVFVRVEELNNFVANISFHVKDSGIGMTPEQMSRLFTPFEQADSKTSRRFGGTGLGLAICRRLVEMMGGSISAQSVIGAGSEFIVTLPFTLKKVASKEDTVRRQEHRRVLVVDDNANFTAYFPRKLSLVLIELSTASNLADACDMLGRFQGETDRFDMVVLDSAMSGGNSNLFNDAVSLAHTRHQAQVVFTANEFRGFDIEGFGRDEHLLIKPILPRELQHIFRKGSGSDDTQPPQLHGKDLFQSLNILLVEDNELNRVVAKGMLEPLGAEVTTAENGSVAVRLIEGGHIRFDVILMDVQMPVMDGYETTRHLRANSVTIPILAMTAGVLATERQQCYNAGMNGFVAKPIVFDKLVTAICAAVGRRDDPRTLRTTHSAAIRESTNVEFYPTEEAASTESGFEEGYLDIRQLLKLSEKNESQRATFTGLVERVVATAMLECNAARRNFEAGDISASARKLHGLRGSIGTLGARRFAESALSLEQSIVKNETVVVDQFRAVEAELDQTLAAAQRWLDRVQEKEAATAFIGASLTDGEMQAFRTLLHDQDMLAISKFNDLRQALIEELGNTAVDELARHISDLNFPAALFCLEKS